MEQSRPAETERRSEARHRRPPRLRVGARRGARAGAGRTRHRALLARAWSAGGGHPRPLDSRGRPARAPAGAAPQIPLAGCRAWRMTAERAKPLAVVCVSGGMDSAVTAAIAAATHSLAFLHADYGQRTEEKER